MDREREKNAMMSLREKQSKTDRQREREEEGNDGQRAQKQNDAIEGKAVKDGDTG